MHYTGRMDEVFSIWPTVADMARDLDRPYTTVAAWKARGIPASHDQEVIEAASRRGVALSFEKMHAARAAYRAGRAA